MDGFQPKTDVIVVGYPKSGNTWVVRLIAELLQCPVKGFWHASHEEIATEGLDRESPFQCWKAHHQFYELDLNKRQTDSVKIIYVVRDPRDIVVSAANYFWIEPRFPLLHKLLIHLPCGLRFYYRFIMTSGYRKRVMTRTVLKGRYATHPWCRIPWKKHVISYREVDAFTVRYEDLLERSEDICRDILLYLGTDRSAEQIRAAIDKQSFAKRRARAQEKGQVDDIAHLRAGKQGQWRRELSWIQRARLQSRLRKTLHALGYN